MLDKRLGRWQVRTFLLCWFAYALVYFGRVNISIAMADLSRFFDVDKATVGALGTVFFWLYAVGQLINGFISDRVSSRIAIFLGLFIAGVCNLAFSLSNNLYLSMVLWGINGIGQSMLWCNIIKTAGQWFSPAQYTKVTVGLNTSMVLGYLMAWGGSGIVLRYLPWQNVFLLPGVVILLFAFVWLFFARDNPRAAGIDAGSHDQTEKSSIHDGSQPVISYKKLFISSGLSLVVVACIAQGMVKEGLGIWAPTMLTDLYGISMSSATSYVLLMPVMNLVGILSVGVLNKRQQRSEQATTILLMVMGIAVLLALGVFAQAWFGAGVLLLAICSGIMYGINTMLLGVLPIQYTKYGRAALVTGVLDFCSYLGAGASAALVGALLDRGVGAAGVFIIWAAILAVALGALMVSARIKKRSVEKVTA